jgi:hypothetical protein
MDQQKFKSYAWVTPDALRFAMGRSQPLASDTKGIEWKNLLCKI